MNTSLGALKNNLIKEWDKISTQLVIRDYCTASSKRLQQVVDAERGDIECNVFVLPPKLLLYKFQIDNVMMRKFSFIY